MFSSINLSPLEELLTSITSPERMAQRMDDLAYDYARTVIELQLSGKAPEPYLHPQSAELLYWLQTLRDAFRACNAK